MKIQKIQKRLCGDNMLLKNTIRKLKHSFGRYFSLLIIVLIGIGFYAGIQSSVPSIKRIQNDYYENTNLMDLTVRSTLGLTDEDVNALKKLDTVSDAIPSYSAYVLNGEEAIKVHAITENINQYELISGRKPKNDNECLADSAFYKVGDTIKITSDESAFKTKEFKVVGTIISPLYTGTNYGYTNIGNGKLHSYIYVPKTAFNLDTYTEIYITGKKTEDDIPYSKAYDDFLDELTNEVESIQSEREEARLTEVKDALIKSAMLTGNTNAEMTDLDSSWYITGRNAEVTGYNTLENQYFQVTTIATIIPLIFVSIVFLMTSNTMTRMITEERTEMGTFSSLGISNTRITLNYLGYVLSGTIIGAIIGYLIGTIFIPPLVYNIFQFHIPDLEYYFDINLFTGCLLVAITLMTIVTVWNCRKSLKEKPANLLRPESPKSGKTIFLEKIKFFWSKLSFSSKITTRNIFRYKKRVFMTLIGSAGCTFLIFIGFALKDSINGVGDKQYGELFTYDNMIVLNNNVQTSQDLTDINDKIKNPLLFNQYSYDLKYGDDESLSVYVVIPENNGETFEDYFNLLDNKTGNHLTLNNDGVIITPKIADKLNLEVGDNITIQNEDAEERKIKITGIAENYISNYIYISKDLYNKIFNEDITYNVVASQNKKGTKAKDILNTGSVMTVNFSDDLKESANNEIKGLNNIVILIVVVSSLLALTVLYNLTSINISERQREIATLKVLGFNGRESNEYIYRETLVVVIIGIIIGLIISVPLHRVIIGFIECDDIMFLKAVKVLSFVYASVLTLVFALIMQVVTYFKLRKVDMIESLKSVE
ncbi:aBC-type antimicrobial peptide transport system permease component [Firmicutes bacterium CAG:822]|nr:aBC-type antimicrobial peptide transport system permease component [Firmicutes bacterium CAG:822]